MKGSSGLLHLIQGFLVHGSFDGSHSLPGTGRIFFFLPRFRGKCEQYFVGIIQQHGFNKLLIVAFTNGFPEKIQIVRKLEACGRISAIEPGFHNA